MEKQLITRYFLGANAYSGFYSLYGGFCAGEGDYLRVIKGGPGTGKSALMRRIGAAAERAGHDVEYILCSGDPDSLDGVYIPALGVGYADGLLRKNSNQIEMLLSGRRVSQVGRICMDITMLDVTGVPCRRGDVVTILGADGDERIAIEELTEKVPTIPHEMLCNISKRVPRIYYRDGKAVARTEVIV